MSDAGIYARIGALLNMVGSSHYVKNMYSAIACYLIG